MAYFHVVASPVAGIGLADDVGSSIQQLRGYLLAERKGSLITSLAARYIAAPVRLGEGGVFINGVFCQRLLRRVKPVYLDAAFASTFAVKTAEYQRVV